MSAIKFPGFKIQMPTDEELRKSSLLWYEQVGQTFINNWPGEVAALSMPTVFVPVPEGIVEALYDDNPFAEPPPLVVQLASELDAAMGFRRHFVRLNSRSPKDGCWPAELPVTCSGKEAVMMLAASGRALDDLCYFRRIPEHPAFICLREYCPDVRAQWEYRCFVKGGDLIAVTHYDYTHPWSGPSDGGAAVRKVIDAYFRDTLKPVLHLADVVFDVHISHRDEVLLIELNPYGFSDPCWLGSYDGVESFKGAVAYAPSDAA